VNRITIRIDNLARVPIRDLSESLALKLNKRFTYLTPASNNRFKGKLVARCVASISGGWFCVPRGAFLQLQHELSNHFDHFDYDVSGVFSVSSKTTPLHHLNVQLRDYQIKAIEACMEKRQGILQMPCGAGKTTTGAAALLHSGEPGVVIVHTKDIQRQWVNTINRLSPGTVVKQTIDCRLRKNQIVVAMIQTLSRNPLQATALLDTAGAVITDECHHVPAATWETIINKCKSRFRWGLTATPERSDGLGFMQNLLVGPTIFRISTTQLIEMGFLKNPYIIPVATGWSPGLEDYNLTSNCVRCDRKRKIKKLDSFRLNGFVCTKCRFKNKNTPLNTGTLNYAAAVTSACRNPDRLHLAVRLISSALRDERCVLVLIPRVNVANALNEILNDHGMPSVVVTGDLPKNERVRRLEEVKCGRKHVLVATQLADEGLDLPRLDCAINLSSGKNAGRARQRVGRTLRMEGKNPIIFEFVDSGPFLRQWAKRRESYVLEYGQTSVASIEPLSINYAIAAARSKNEPDIF